MSYFHKSRSWNTICAYNFNEKLTVLIDFSLVSSRDPLWLELMWCSLFAIDGVCEPLSSRSSFVGCIFKCWFKGPLLFNAHMFIKCVGVPCLSMHVSSFFLSSLHFFYFELLKFVPPFVFFRLWRLYYALVPSCVHRCSPIFFLCSLIFTHHSTPLTKWPFTNIILST